MKPSSTHEVTQLLLAWSNGDQTALEELTPLVYAELHRLAERYMRRGHSAKHAFECESSRLEELTGFLKAKFAIIYTNE